MPADVTLYQLHRILQIVIGWSDSHLHQFRHGDVLYGEPDPEFGVPLEDERQVRLAEVLSAPKERIVYEYDFGDAWEHEVVLEVIDSPEPGVQYPRVLAGKGACPPEDVGGIGGYSQFLKAIADPKHPEHQEMREWLGGSFDPSAFDLEEVNRSLRPRTRRAPNV